MDTNTQRSGGATISTIVLGSTDPDLAVAGLRHRGIPLEGDIVEGPGHHPSTGATGERAIWFRDSEGNLLSVGQPVYG